MNVRYDLKKLKKIIDDLCTVTGLSMALVDTKFNFLYMRTRESDAVCIKVHETPEGSVRCSCSDMDIVKLCAEQKRPVSHICHAGLLDTVVPIMKGATVAGFIIIGRVRPKEDMSYMAEMLSSGEDYDEIKDRYQQMIYLTPEQMDSIINLISHIIFDNAIEVDYNEFISRATGYIESNLTSDLSIGALCEELYVSKNRLYKSFHSYFGITVNEYIIDRRMKRAMELLKGTDESAFSIAEAVGISNYAYFSRLFKEKTGFSPKEYRKIK